MAQEQNNREDLSIQHRTASMVVELYRIVNVYRLYAGRTPPQDWEIIIKDALLSPKFKGTAVKNNLVRMITEVRAFEFVSILEDLRRLTRDFDQEEIELSADINRAIFELAGDVTVRENEAAILEDGLARPIKRANLLIAIRTMQYVGDINHIDLLVRYLGRHEYNIANWILTAIRGIGYRHNTSRANLTFGGDRRDPKACLAQFVLPVEYESFRKSSVYDPIWLKSEIDLLVHYVHSEDIVLRILALLAISAIPGNCEYRENQIGRILSESKKCDKISEEEAFALRYCALSVSHK